MSLRVVKEVVKALLKVMEGGVPGAGEWDEEGGAEEPEARRGETGDWGGKSPARGRSAGECSPLFLLVGDDCIGATLHGVRG